ncbi:BTAD domain-containing putative transcriptional regulator [Streptomyces sp. NPDC052114]|uniref:AfsR/SARP family transcriptional regulator n=1 Tax=unclassified Streptomyces TaxID=2593676 RepID=UPI003419B4FE
MRFGVLGPLAVWNGEGEPVKVPEAKVRALLADLLVHEGRPVSADRLIDDLWGEAPPGRPANALQSKVSQLRRALGRDRVVHQAPGYRLRVDAAAGDEVDADVFRALVDAARREADPAGRAELLTRALDLWRGPAYADLADEEFVRAAADRLAEQRLAVLEEQAEARLAAGDHTLLTGELADLVARYPLRERLRAVQLRALYLAGRQTEALASYAALRDQLAEELGLDPSPELTSLHEAILRQDPSLSAPAYAYATAPAARTHVTSRPDGSVPSAPAVRSALTPRTSPPTAPTAPHHPATPTDPTTSTTTPTTPRTNLPAHLTPLLGREQALADVGQLLATARLVTLTGPGGVGKTRLALAAAGESLSSGASRGAAPDGGVWVVELAARRGGGVDALALAVSAALGLRDDTPSALPGPAPTGAAPVERLAAALRDRRTLLVLDNCEQVVEAAAELTGALLRAAPGLRVLATSQEPLGLTGEAVFLVEPLGPDDAVSLFTARASAAAPGFSPADGGPDAEAAVAEICRRLDGIPLALELAATRVRALGVRELADRLGDRFRLLTSGQRGAPERQQTLRAVIDWSWELLSAPERIVLRRLAVHRDGCTLEAAEAVCAGDGVARDEVMDLVTRLVDRSLVVMAPGPAGTAPRYRLLESVAAYALERLAEMEDLLVVRERYLHHYLGLAERAEPCLRGGDQRVWLALLDAEAANLRGALDEGLRRGAAEEAARLGSALAWWWLLRGRLAEAGAALSAVLALDPSRAELRLPRDSFALLTGSAGAARAPEEAPHRPRTLWLYAYALFSSGDPAASEEANARVLDAADRTGDRWATAAALALRSMHALIRGDLATIGDDGRRAAALFAELGDRWGELQTVTPLAVLAEIKGEYDEAARRQTEGLRIARELGLEAEVSARLSGLGRIALLTHDWARARELHEKARTLAVEHGYRYGEIHSDMGLALGARRSGDLAAAETLLHRIRDRHADVSSPTGDHLLHAELGFLAELRGDATGAGAHHRVALDIARTLAEPRALALSLEGLAGAAALSGAPGDAALLLGAADAARASVGAPLPPAERADVDRITAAARTALGAPAFTEAFERGAELPIEELPVPR